MFSIFNAANRFVTAIVFCFGAETVLAGDNDPRLATYSRLARFTPAEGAGSHGSTGFVLGAGLRDSSVPVPDLIEGNPDSAVESASVQEKRLQWGEIFLTKGLSWPVDIGGGYSRPASGDLQRFSGYAQWTLYEALAMPALAVRSDYSRVFGFGGSMSAIGLQGLGSYGFLRYFTIYGGFGVDFMSGNVDNPSRMEEQLSLSPTGESYAGHADWTETSNFYGLRVLALPPTGTITAEVANHGSGDKSYIAKVAFGM